MNAFVDLGVNFRFFFARKTMFVKYAQGFVVLPGGFGTFDELFEALTLVQTHKVTEFPIVLVGTEYWSGLLDWLRTPSWTRGMISEGPRPAHLVDDPAEAVRSSCDRARPARAAAPRSRGAPPSGDEPPRAAQPGRPGGPLGRDARPAAGAPLRAARRVVGAATAPVVMAILNRTHRLVLRRRRGCDDAAALRRRRRARSTTARTSSTSAGCGPGRGPAVDAAEEIAPRRPARRARPRAVPRPARQRRHLARRGGPAAADAGADLVNDTWAGPRPGAWSRSRAGRRSASSAPTPAGRRRGPTRSASSTRPRDAGGRPAGRRRGRRRRAPSRPRRSAPCRCGVAPAVGARRPDPRLRQEHLALAAPAAPHRARWRARFPGAHGAVPQGLRGGDAGPAGRRAARGHARRDRRRRLAGCPGLPRARRPRHPAAARHGRRDPGDRHRPGPSAGWRERGAATVDQRATGGPGPDAAGPWAGSCSLGATGRGGRRCSRSTRSALFTTVVFLSSRAPRANPWTGIAPVLPVRRPHVRRLLVPPDRRERLSRRAARRRRREVQQNAWAFFPLFPLLARGLMRSRGAPWDVVAPPLALVLGGAARCCSIHRTVAAGAPRAVARAARAPARHGRARQRLPDRRPCCRSRYTESLALLLIAAPLLLLLRRRVRLDGARGPGARVHARRRAADGRRRARARRGPLVVARRRGGGPVHLARGAGLGRARGRWRAASGLVWPAVCGWATGVPDAYVRTQEAWRGVADVSRSAAGPTCRVLVRRPRAPRWWSLRFAAGARGARRAGGAGGSATSCTPGPPRYVLYIAAVVEPGQQPRPVPAARVPARRGRPPAWSPDPPAARRWWWRRRRAHARAAGGVGLADVAANPPYGWPP